MTDASRTITVPEFIEELNGFALTAEQILQNIEQDPNTHQNLFNIFAEKMFAIRGTAAQLNLLKIEEIALLGEEISIKGVAAERRSQIRKCVGSLWDALTTVKYLLQHPESETTEEQEILVNRLKRTLDAFGGAREKINSDEIDAMLKSNK